MLEMKVTITAATDLMAVLNNIAAALDGKNPHTVCNQFGADSKHIDNAGTINMGVGGKAQPATPTAPVNPTPAPVATPAPAPGAPLSATPAQTATPIAPTVPVAAPAPTVTPAANVAPAPAVPTSAPQYTLDMIATAGSALIDAGKMDQLMGLLGKFGVASLTELAPESYGAVANELRALGAAI
ncbi:MAG: hypothetical protein SOX69_05255 [Oscillospiraceae bacterium]|nr:hypothetical protein [Oscillospiraceae bacterium]